MNILVTGFDAFGVDTMNPSILAVKRLPDIILGATIIKLELQTVFNKSTDIVKEVLLNKEIDYILHVGQAGGRFELTPERVAINIDDARIPDNANYQPVDLTIKEEGAPAYFTQHPIKAMVTAMKNAGIPASVSNSAGTFVCNHIMYHSLFLSHTEFKKVKVGFIHIPFLPEQVINQQNQPSMSLEMITEGIKIAIETIIEFDGKEDLKVIGGKIH